MISASASHRNRVCITCMNGCSNSTHGPTPCSHRPILSLLSPMTLTLATNAKPSLPNVCAQYVASNCLGRHTSTSSIQLPSNNLPAQKSKLTSSEHSATFHFSSKDTATQQLQIQVTSQSPSMNSLSQYQESIVSPANVARSTHSKAPAAPNT